MVKALSLVTMPILTRYLSPSAYGEAALVGTVVSLAGVFALAGIDMGYARHVFSGKLGSAAAVELFCWRWTLGSAGLIAVLVGVLWWIVAELLGLAANLTGFAIAGVFASVLATMATTRARLEGHYARLSWVQFATGCGAAATSIGIAMLWRQDAWALLAAMVVGYAMPVILLGAPPWRRLVLRSGLTRKQGRCLLATGLAGIVTAPAYWVVSSSDRWFLAASHDSATVGIYSIAFTVGTIGAVVSTAITSAWLPELSRDESGPTADFSANKPRMIQLLAAILLVVAVAVAASGGDVIRALSDVRFHAAALVVPWLAAGVLFYGCLHVGNALLVLAGKLHWAAIAWGIALLASLVLNSWLIPRYGIWGAAITQAVSFLLVMVLVWVAVLYFERIPLRWFNLLAGLALSVLVTMTMQAPWAASAWHSLWLKFPVGLLFAAACMRIVAPGMLTAASRKMKGVFDVRSSG